MKLRLLSILVFLCVALTGASADSITWNFATAANANLGTNTNTYTSDGFSITATGSSNLYDRPGTGSESGLGLACCDSDHEISAGQSITFDLSSLFSSKVTSLALTLNSIQTGESAKVCDVDNLCITFNSSDNSRKVSILSLYYDMLAHHSGDLTVTGVTGDVLVDKLQATTSTVPEPGSFLLLGTGLFMIALAGRSALKQRAAATI